MLFEKLLKNISAFAARHRILLLSFFIPAAIMLLSYGIRGIYPFGNRSVLLIDLYHQYAPFLAELRQKLLSGGSFAYTWSGGLGGSFYPLYAYYLASPLNLLIVLFPPSFLTEAVLVLILLKTGLAGLCFALFLMGAYSRRKDWSVAAFSVLYALSGYVLAYSWNIMWMDGVFLLPLTVLGLVRLIRDNRGGLYYLSLTLMIFSNFYIAFILCIFLGFYYPLCWMQFTPAGSAKAFFKKSGQFAFYSLTAAGTTALLTLPTWFSLQNTSATGDAIPKTVDHFFDLFDYISRHLAFVPPSIREGMPNLYAGFPLLILLPVFFLSGRIRHRVKLYAGLLMLFLVIGFNTNILNFIWHGFHYPNQLPYRNSIVYIFLVLSLAYPAYHSLPDFSRRQIGALCGGIVILLLLLQKFETPQLNIWIIYANIVVALAWGAVLTMDRKRTLHRGGALACCFVFFLAITGEAALNTLWTVETIDRTEYYAIRNDYAAGPQVREIREQIAALSSANPDFFRMEIVPPKTTNDPFLYGYRGLSVFSSTFPENTVKTIQNFGYHTNGINSYKYEGSTLLLDALFGIRYLFRRSGGIEDRLRTRIYEGDALTIYENPYALPLGLFLPESAQDFRSSSNPMTSQNELIRNATGVRSIFSMINLQQGSTENLSFEGSDTRYFRFKRTRLNLESAAVIRLLSKEPGHYYFYIDSRPNQLDGGKVFIGERELDFNPRRSTLVEIGWLEADTPVEIRLSIRDTSEIESGSFEIQGWRLQEENFKEAMSILQASAFQMDSFEETRIAGRITAETPGILLFSMPFDSGWQVLINGGQAETYAFDGGLLSVPMEAGSHSIELHFVPKKFHLALAISLLSLSAFLMVNGSIFKLYRFAAQRMLKAHSTVPLP